MAELHRRQVERTAVGRVVRAGVSDGERVRGVEAVVRYQLRDRLLLLRLRLLLPQHFPTVMSPEQILVRNLLIEELFVVVSMVIEGELILKFFERRIL